MPSVINHNGFDYWDTWFIEECETANLFGFNEGHLQRITRMPYRVGTRIFLVDEPYFRKTIKYHRICGPFEIVAMDDKMPRDAEPIHVVDNKIIVFKEVHPENGPWKNGRIKREMNGRDYTVHQIADDYNYFPYRFGIRYVNYTKREKTVKHKPVDCWVCRIQTY